MISIRNVQIEGSINGQQWRHYLSQSAVWHRAVRSVSLQTHTENEFLTPGKFKDYHLTRSYRNNSMCHSLVDIASRDVGDRRQSSRRTFDFIR